MNEVDAGRDRWRYRKPKWSASALPAQECVFRRKLSIELHQHRPTIIYQDCEAAQRDSLKHMQQSSATGGRRQK
jgi:hypothetical protein